MKVYKNSSDKVWKNWFGISQVGIDIAGRKIYKKEYNTDTKYSWSIDHIQPIDKGGTDNIKNLAPVHKQTNIDKANNFPIFNSNNHTVTIVKNNRTSVNLYWDFKLEDESETKKS